MKSETEIDPVVLKTIEYRIDAIKEATSRSRAVFLIMTVVCAMILFGLWNALLSWERGYSTMDKSSQPKVEENQKKATEEWIKNLYVSAGIFGIRVSVNDLAVIGSLSLVVIMVWFFFVQRRENRAIVSLLQYCCADGAKNAARQLNDRVFELVHEGIVQSIVFIDMGGGDKPIMGLQIKNGGSAESNKFTRFILLLLTYLPPFTIAMIVAADLSSLFIQSYIRDDFVSLWTLLQKEFRPVEIAKIVAYETVALLCFAYTGSLCYKCREFSEATAETIKDFKKQMVDRKIILSK